MATPEAVQPLSQKEKGAAILMLLGAGLAALGSFLPWISVSTGFGSTSRNGMEGGDGVIILIVAILAGLAAGAPLADYKIGGFLHYSPILAAGVIATITVFDHIEIIDRIDTFASEAGAFGSATVGAGIWSIYVGAAAMALGWWNRKQAQSPTKVEPAIESGTSD